MKNKAPFFFLLLVLFAACKQDPYTLKQSVTIAFYNVENLFDTIDDPAINDDDFLPGSDKKWNTERYNKKLNDLAKVLASINKEEFPELIGLCEVENLSVLEDLVETEELAAGKYRIVHVDSPDKRGIDVALLYRASEFTAFSHDAILVNPGFETRDILYVNGKLGKEEVHLLINHWPSRIGGVKKSEPYRILAAEILKDIVDDILKEDAQAKIIIMGDMNDEPDNKSLAEVLEAASPDTIANLYNLMFPVKEQNEGSYYYQGNWNILDNLIVSESVLHGDGFVVNDEFGKIFHEPWMEYINKNGNMLPDRTYSGSYYNGGVSDHFPVYVQLEK